MEVFAVIVTQIINLRLSVALASSKAFKSSVDPQLTKPPYSEADRPSATQEIARILWNAKVLYHIRKRPDLVSVLSQIYPLHASRPTS